MRLSKTAWLVLGIGIFIIAFAAMYSINSGQSGEQEQLNDGLAKNQALLPNLIAEREDLESQLAEWEKKVAEVTVLLDQSKGRFPHSVESVDYDAILFRIADDCDLQVTKLTVSEPGSTKVPLKLDGKKVEDIVYDTTTLEVKVRSKESPPNSAGDFETYIDDTMDNMLDFINDIVTSDEFNVCAIEVVDMKKLEPPDAEDLEDADDAARWGWAPEATIKLIIYGYKGG
jgi:hypothetical protein